jgi:hypothetical protein
MDEVADASFDLDAYEYIHGHDSGGDAILLHGGGDAGITSTGFGFKESGGGWLYGPLTAILAVRTG